MMTSLPPPTSESDDDKKNTDNKKKTNQITDAPYVKLIPQLSFEFKTENSEDLSRYLRTMNDIYRYDTTEIRTMNVRRRNYILSRNSLITMTERPPDVIKGTYKYIIHYCIIHL